MSAKKNMSIRKKYAEVLYLYYASAYKVREIRDFPEYIADEAGLDLGYPVIRDLLRRGYLEQEEKGRIIISPCGFRLLDSNRDMIQFFEAGCLYCGIEDFCAKKREMRCEDFYTVMNCLLEERILQAKKEQDYACIRSLSKDLALMKEEREPEYSVRGMLTALLISVSGAEYSGEVERYRAGHLSYAKLKNLLNDYVFADVQIMDFIRRHRELCGDSAAEQVYDETELAFTLCSRDNFTGIVRGIIKRTFVNMWWQQVFRKRFAELFGDGGSADREEEEKLEAMSHLRVNQFSDGGDGADREYEEL